MDYTVAELIKLLFTEDDARFSLVWRDDLDYNDHCKDFEKLLNNYLIEEKRVNKWPGTELDSIAATIRYYHLNKNSASILERVVSPFDFISPNYPEDIAFYKEGKLVYGSIAHEQYDWFENL